MATETEAQTEHAELHDVIRESMDRLHVPGVALGLMVDGKDHVAAFGVTNVNHPAPVETDTLFQIGSTTKTITATTIMRLVESGQVELDVPVRTYLPDLRLHDEGVAAAVTVRHLLTHTAGWVGDYFADTGRGDDALATVVVQMADLPQLTPLGTVWSYNNAAFYLAGRVIEAVTGKPYEAAARELVLEPLGLKHSFFFPEEAMVHSFAVGHNVVDDVAQVATPWALARTANPAGGLASSAGDQLRYARFHMGDGTAEDGTRVLSPESMALMQTPMASAGVDRKVGLSWFLREIEGVRIVEHGGGTNGQVSEFMFAPERNFALTLLTNANRGGELALSPVKWALKQYLGIAETEPVPEFRSDQELAAYAGRYTSSVTALDLTMQEGALVVAMSQHDFPADTPPPVPPPFRMAVCGTDRVVALDGPMEGTTAEFLRDNDGAIEWLRMGGRIHRRERE